MELSHIKHSTRYFKILMDIITLMYNLFLYIYIYIYIYKYTFTVNSRYVGHARDSKMCPT